MFDFDLGRFAKSVVRHLVKTFVSVFRKLPLIGELVDTPRKYQFAAIQEMAWSTFLATLPIWFFPIAASILFRSAPAIHDGIWHSIVQGDLYLYSAAIVGPLMFALTAKYIERDSDSATAKRIGRYAILFPYGTWFIVISFIIVGVSTFFFGFMRYKSAGQIEAVLNDELLTYVSIGIYSAANIAMLLVIAYRNKLQNLAAESIEDTHSFVDEFLHGGANGRDN